MSFFAKVFNMFCVSSDVDVSADQSFKMAFSNVINFFLLMQSLAFGLYALLEENALASTLNLLFSLFFISYFVVAYVLRNLRLFETFDRLAVFCYFLLLFSSCGPFKVVGIEIALYPFVAIILHGRHVGIALSLVQLGLVVVSHIISYFYYGPNSPFVFETIEFAFLFFFYISCIFIYYVAIRWLSTMIYDKNRELKIQAEELDVKKDLIRRLTEDAMRPLREISESVDILSSERLNPLQRELVGLVSIASRKASANIESVIKADKVNIPVLSSEESEFDLFALVSAIIKVFKSRESVRKHEFTTSNNVPKRLVGNSEVTRVVLLNILDSLDERLSIADKNLRINVSRNVMSDKGLEIVFDIALEADFVLDRRDVGSHEVRLVDYFNLHLPKRLIETSGGGFSIHYADKLLEISYSLKYRDVDSRISKLDFSSDVARVDLDAMPVAKESKVLVVSPDDVFCTLVADSISSIVGQVVVVTSLQQAVDVFTNNMVGFVVFDWHVDPSGGVSLCKKLRAVESGVTSRVPLVGYIPDSCSTQDFINLSDAGCDSILYLPFDAELLRATVCSCFICK